MGLSFYIPCSSSCLLLYYSTRLRNTPFNEGKNASLKCEYADEYTFRCILFVLCFSISVLAWIIECDMSEQPFSCPMGIGIRKNSS